MRLLLFIFLLGLISVAAWAANTNPPGTDGQLIYNKNNQWGAACVGNGLLLTTTAGGTCLGLSGPTGDFITTESGDPIVTETGDNIVTETSP